MAGTLYNIVILSVLLFLYQSAAYSNFKRIKTSGNVRIVKSERLGLKLLSGAHKERSFILYAVEESTEEPPTDKQKRKLKRKAKINSDMMRYSEEVLKPWKMADSFNSTTMRFLFEVKVRTNTINSTHSASSYLATHIAFTYAI